MSNVRKLLQRADEQGRRSAVLLDEREHTYSDLGAGYKKIRPRVEGAGCLTEALGMPCPSQLQGKF